MTNNYWFLEDCWLHWSRERAVLVIIVLGCLLRRNLNILVPVDDILGHVDDFFRHFDDVLWHVYFLWRIDNVVGVVSPSWMLGPSQGRTVTRIIRMSFRTSWLSRAQVIGVNVLKTVAVDQNVYRASAAYRGNRPWQPAPNSGGTVLENVNAVTDAKGVGLRNPTRFGPRAEG